MQVFYPEMPGGERKYFRQGVGRLGLPYSNTLDLFLKTHIMYKIMTNNIRIGDHYQVRRDIQFLPNDNLLEIMDIFIMLPDGPKLLESVESRYDIMGNIYIVKS